MKRGYVLLVALVALAFSLGAAAQTWTGTGDADPIIALQWEGEADTVTATASGYEFTVSVTDTDGAGGAAGLTDVAPQDWTFTVDFGTDLLTAANGGYILCGIWAGEVTSGDFWADQPRQVWAETVEGDYGIESDSPTSDYEATTVTGDPGTMSFRLSQSGDTITMEYTEPGSTTFLTLGTDDALDTATDFGVIMFPYAGVGFDEDATVLIETVTLTLGGAEPGPGAGDCPCGNQGADTTDGADMCVLSGEYVAGSEVHVMMTIDGEQVEIVEAGWWESRANDREAGGATYEELLAEDDGTLIFTLTQEMIDGLGEGASGYIEATVSPETHWLYYNFDELCWGAAEPEGPGVVIGGDTHRKEVSDDLSLGIELTNIEDPGYTVQWGKDGAPLEGETGDTLTVLDLTTDDSGLYDVVVTYTPVEEGGDAAYDEVSDEFFVMVFPLGEAPLVGGLGLGLLAGACALAGAVAIRRKK